MSAEIIPFVPRPNRASRPNGAPAVFRPAIGPDDLTMDHVDTSPFDTAPCEYVWPSEDSHSVDPGAWNGVE